MTTQADFVELALNATETTETTLGTISIPVVGIKHIVGIYGITSVITTTGESAYGYFRLAFKTVPGIFRFPTTIFSNPAGTLASPLATGAPQIIPCDIMVPANETVTCIMALHAVATGACRGMIGLIFE